MSGNRTALTAFAFVALIASAALGGVMVHPVSAQDGGENSVVDALFADGSENGDSGGWPLILSFAKGKAAKYNPLAEHPEKASAGEYASRVETTFNQNSSHIRDWTNARATADTEYDTFRFQFKDESGNTKWLFLVGDVNTTTGNYTDARMMNLTEFRKLDREVDTTYYLSPYASRNANAELETFITQYAKPGKDIEQSYLAKLAAEYRGEITGGELPGGS